MANIPSTHRCPLLVTALSLILTTGLARAQDSTPPTPKWLFDITRVAYTDLSNIQRAQDWPDKVIPDLAEAGVQMFFSRSHSGDTWEGLGWIGNYGAPDPQMKGKLIDWQISGGGRAEDGAHAGQRCLRLVHAPVRKETYLNRHWEPRSGRQDAMLDLLKGSVCYWYKAVSAKNAKLWLGVIPMSKDPLENTGESRTGIQVPPEHIGDGQWHQVTIDYDYTKSAKVKWLQVSCFITGDAAELLLDDVEYVGTQPQPITNGNFETTEKDRDGTREVTDLCHKNGIKYITYYWAQREPKSVGEAHPDWKCLNAKGKPTVYYCTNNADYRTLVRDRIVELVRDVGVDGIFFDMFHARADECYCDACKRKFRDLTGEGPPVKEDFDSLLWQQWVDFKYRSIEEALLDFNRAIKAANPEAVLIVNTWNAWVYRNGHNIRNSIRVADVVDGLLEETGWYDVVDPSFFAAPALHNFMDWHLAGLCKRTRAFMWSSPSMPGWRSILPLEPRIRVMTMLTNGCVPAQSAPDRAIVKTYMGEIAERDAYFRGAALYPWCGLVVSEKTELWYGRDDPKERYVKGVYGAYQAMLERHLPVSLVTDRELELGQLEPYKVLFMPNCAAMSDKELDTVRKFVENGGGLVTTYETSLYDEHARPRDNFGLADLMKARKTGTFDNLKMRAGWDPIAVHNAFLYFPPDFRWAQDPVVAATLATKGVTTPADRNDPNIPLHCRMLLVEPDGVPASPLRVTTAHYDKATGQTARTNNVALVESTYGKGKVIYLPYDISWAFFRYGHDYLGRIMELALREVASAPPPVEVAAPAIVQTMTYAQGNRLVVHLLNDISSTGRSQNVPSESLYLRREVIPIHDIQVTFRDPALKRFTLVPGNVALTPTPTDAGLTVTVPKLDIHGMVVAEP
ncbi:MAG: hypothetical protein A3K19_09345 [Lentisphaerae bacterium RIFOXYB12_FULL_65_16]|nr:MAG: hypothetical protein A3K18_22360 [Lentisphaerae bacterium RIFOXYA12_64_32]OGV90399.1 MAG: hypothetical protein A3K19_09345 [Lentisphaerae bacterium RIFOXYB12_FULL_65_16]